MEEESLHSAESLMGDLHELFTDSDNDTTQYSFQEEMIEGVMQELYNEIIACSPPLPEPLPPAAARPLPPPPPSRAPNAIDGKTEKGSLQEDKKMEEDAGDFDDEWLAAVLISWGQVLDGTNE